MDIAGCYAIIWDMVDLETVLVLGAGASKDFGFPTGKELVRQICDQLSNQENKEFELFYECANKLSPEVADKFPFYLKQADPPSVDAWLEHNPPFIDVGKVAIAIALLWYEHKYQHLSPENNWYGLLFQRLNSPFDRFQDNKVSIITFNYDRSLEQYLFKTFRYTHTAKSHKECEEKLNQLRIVHVYGSLGRLEWQCDDPQHSIPQVPYGKRLDRDSVLSAAKSIKIMPEGQEPGIEFDKARSWIKYANSLYFLGFGYHKTNMERLGIEILNRPSKVMGTSLGLDYQRIREVERLRIRHLKTKVGLLQESVYEFLHEHVNFNEDGYPAV